jgi:hypothetical protein
LSTLTKIARGSKSKPYLSSNQRTGAKTVNLSTLTTMPGAHYKTTPIPKAKDRSEGQKHEHSRIFARDSESQTSGIQKSPHLRTIINARTKSTATTLILIHHHPTKHRK